MRRLLVDIGNTRIKWRWAQGRALQEGGAESLAIRGQEGALFTHLWGTALTPSQVVVSNVAGDQVREALKTWCSSSWGYEPHFVASRVRQCGVTNGYENPESLGVDRWCALIGARVLVAGPACVVDCGTAITLDALNADGEHQGGLVAPGLRTMLQALGARAWGIPSDITPAAANLALGRTTLECVRSGVLAASAGMVEHALERIAFSAHGTLLLTGGDAPLLAGLLRRPFRIEPELLFLGLAELAAGVDGR